MSNDYDESEWADYVEQERQDERTEEEQEARTIILAVRPLKGVVYCVSCYVQYEGYFDQKYFAQRADAVIYMEAKKVLDRVTTYGTWELNEEKVY